MYTYIIHDIGGNLIVLYIGDKVVAKEVIVITTDEMLDATSTPQQYSLSTTH